MILYFGYSFIICFLFFLLTGNIHVCSGKFLFGGAPPFPHLPLSFPVQTFLFPFSQLESRGLGVLSRKFFFEILDCCR